MSQRVVKFGIIGLGLMGRELASAMARWCHLLDASARPEIVAVCDRSAQPFEWFKDNFPAIRQFTHDYKELLANPDVEAIYCAVPHNLHQELYCDIIQAKKHLLAEKPFGIDLKANQAINQALRENPEVLVRCSSEFPFFPAVQKIGSALNNGEFGKIIEVNAGFLHSSDADINKPINWKRQIAANGEYGCMGDLGLHVCHFPLRAGFQIHNVRAILSNLVPERPDGKGGMAICETWDNATLFCETIDRNQNEFPMTLKTQRIAPGEKDTWFLEVKGMQLSMKFSTRMPNLLQVCRQNSWVQEEVGYEPAFPTITGKIFEFGFSDAILQMVGAFVEELGTKKDRSIFAYCATPEECMTTHKLFTAALQSHKGKKVVCL